MAYIFKLSEEKKQLLRSFIPLLDMDTPGLEGRVQDLITVENWGGQLSQSIIEFGILAHGYKDFDGTLEVVRQLTKRAIQASPPRHWAGGPLWNLWQAARRIEEPNTAILELGEKVLVAVQKDPQSWVDRANKDLPVENKSVNRVAQLGLYLGVYYTFHAPNEIPELVSGYINRAIQDNDIEYLKLYVSQELMNLFEMGSYRGALVASKAVIQCEDEGVRAALVDFLVAPRIMSPSTWKICSWRRIS
jgi:hypothetical protein